MLPLNIMDVLTRPITLSLRLFGNMLAGTVMLGVIALLPPAVNWLPTMTPAPNRATVHSSAEL
ncbi:MAG: F0F1 ATP synthase subunit A [Pseudonocardiaceae bacterium]